MSSKRKTCDWYQSITINVVMMGLFCLEGQHHIKINLGINQRLHSGMKFNYEFQY